MNQLEALDAIRKLNRQRALEEPMRADAARRAKMAEALGMARSELGANVGSYQNPQLMRLGNAEQIAAETAPQQNVDQAVWGLGGRKYNTGPVGREAMAPQPMDRAALAERLGMMSGGTGKYQDGSTLPGSRTQVSVRPDGRIALIGGLDENQRIAAKEAAYARSQAAPNILQGAREAKIKGNLAKMMGSSKPEVRARAQLLAEKLGVTNGQGGGGDDLTSLVNSIRNFAGQGMSVDGQRAMMSAFMQQRELANNKAIEEQRGAALTEREREKIAAEKEIEANRLRDAAARAAQVDALSREQMAQNTASAEADRLLKQRQFEEEMALKRDPNFQRAGLVGRGADLETIDAVVPPTQSETSSGVFMPKVMAPEQKAAAIQALQTYGLSNPGLGRDEVLSYMKRLGLTPEDLRAARPGLESSWTESPFEQKDGKYINDGISDSLIRAFAWGAEPGTPGGVALDRKRRSRDLFDMLIGG